MGVVGKRIWGGFAAVVGDKTSDWMTQSLLEHYPTFASAPSLALLGSERQLVRGRPETDASYANRLILHLTQWKLAGSDLGLLVALYYAGFVGAASSTSSTCIVQQNGVYGYLSGDPLALLQAMARGDDRTTWPATFVTGQLDVLATPMHSNVDLSRYIPAGNAWWTFDSDTDHTSRFAILFPSGGSAFTTTATAIFTGVEDGITIPWPTATWNNPFPDTSYIIQVGAVYPTDGSGGIAASADATTKTVNSVGVVASAPFVGTVELLAWQVGANPYADLHAADLARLQLLINLWRPKKALCVGIYVATKGWYWDWPVRTWNTNGTTWDTHEVVSFSPGVQ